jgi:hypothetical protein
LFTLACGASLLVLALVSCGNGEPKDVVGQWVPEQHSPKVIKNLFLSKPVLLTLEPSVTFRSDATFVLENVPEILLFGGGKDRDKIVSGTGKWAIGKYAGTRAVLLEFKTIDGKDITSATQMQISTGPNGVTLYFWIEEEGGPRFEFVKKRGQ